MRFTYFEACEFTTAARDEPGRYVLGCGSNVVDHIYNVKGGGGGGGVMEEEEEEE